jgi:hypothetical protein
MTVDTAVNHHEGDAMTDVLDPQMQSMLDAAKPRPEHEWLQQLVGEWTYESEMAEPGKPPVKVKGTGRTRAIGDIWITSEGEGEMGWGCGMASTMTVLGYDPEKGRFVGTWLGTMMSKLWVYEGFLDETKRVLTLESEGPSMTKEGETGKYRDIFTIIDEDYHTMTGNFLGDDGVWHEMMTMHFRRKK